MSATDADADANANANANADANANANAKAFARVEAAFDTLLSMPEAARPAAIARLAGGDAAFAQELHSLLAAAEGDDALLDRPATLSLRSAGATSTTLPPGTCIGPYAVERLVGQGGMGEVYSAQRVDGSFEQRVAIKMLRAGGAAHGPRFDAERQILARLAHPNIARLLDGGLTGDGRPYMVMEFVDGIAVTRWCQARSCGVAQRLALLLKICDAVACAHRNLVVHRDIKPENVLVTPDGVPMLLDFGIARGLALPSAQAEQATRDAPLTLAYAAPEQLTGGAITTATDVYALGVLMFELLAGQRPWGGDALPMAAALRRVLEDVPPLTSQVATHADAPALAGDLDAIVAKALRKEPEQRYATVAALAGDIGRHLRHEAIGARAGARWYAFTRTAWRYRVLLATFTVVALVSTSAALGLAWQARRADLAAQRALKTKEFLVSVFRAADTRLPSDKPRGAITARELLDRQSERIEAEFADEPELQVELLGLVAEIYSDLDEDARFRVFQRRRMAVATRLYGPSHPIVVDGLLADVREALQRQDYALALRGLADIDARWRAAGHDDADLRARWWVARAEALVTTPGAQPAMREADERAIALLHGSGQRDATLAEALDNLAQLDFIAADYGGAETLFEQAIDVQSHLRERNDADLAVLIGERAKVRAALGRFDEAERDFEASATLFLRTTGPRFGSYWQVLAEYASMVHARGQDARATALFATMRAAIPADWSATTDDAIALERYARCLVADGRAREAVPLLRRIEERQRQDRMWPDDLRRARLTLGNALAAAGDLAAAHPILRSALDDYVATEPLATPDGLEARRSMASLLLDETDRLPVGTDDPRRVDAARLLQEVAQAAPRLGRVSAEPALAMAQQARLSMQAGDGAAALAQLAVAQAAFNAVTATKDVRGQAAIERLRARALCLTARSASRCA